MQCLRCGRKIEGTQVFCDDCRAEMEKQPIKPGTPVTIPQRPPSVPRSPMRVQEKPEEQIARMHHQIRRLHLWVAGLLAAVMLVGGVLVYGIWSREEIPQIGSNYSPMNSEPRETK